MTTAVLPPRLGSPSTAAEDTPPEGVSSIDLIIELYKRDVDRTLIIEQLKKTPDQRIRDLQQLHDFGMEMRRAFSGVK